MREGLKYPSKLVGSHHLANDRTYDSSAVVDKAKHRCASRTRGDAPRRLYGVLAFEPESQNDGYRRFPENSSREHAPIIVNSLRRIEDDERDNRWSWCDEAEYQSAEEIAVELFAYLKQNRASLQLP